MDIKSLRFAAKATRKECSGCLFENERSSVCKDAAGEAKARGLPDCDDADPDGRSYIYVEDPTDPRQIPLLEPPT
jgi:hypothetical protein